MAEVDALIEEARGLSLFKAHAAFEVHCSNCHSRLDPAGDCSSCGLIGRAEADVAKRSQGDAAAVEKLLRGQIAKRRAYRPVKAARETP
jgi:hypothetical protein